MELLDAADPKPEPNIKGKKCYRYFSYEIHGYLGKGNRIELPACVVKKIREAFPNVEDSNGNTVSYVGFKEA